MPTPTLAEQTAIASLYAALFNRAPDASGFSFWTTALADGAPLTSITASFLNSPESTAIYAPSQSAAAFVATFYQTVFGRTPDAGGLAFWTDVLDAAGGVESTTAKVLLVSKIVEIVGTSLPTKPADLTDVQYAQTVADRTLFSQKMAIGIDFAVNLKSDDLALAKQAFANMNAPTTPPPATPTMPQTFLLTLDPDTFVGGTAGDTFTAPLVGGAGTLNSGDVLDGGAGLDRLDAVLANPATVAPTLRDIEVVSLTTGGSNVSLDLANATGVTAAGFSGGVASSAGTLRNVGDAGLFVVYQTSAASFTGSTATNLVMTFVNVGAAGNLTAVDLASAGAGPVATSHDILAYDAHVRLGQSVAGASVTSLNVHAQGVNALQLSWAVATTVETLTVTGTGAVDFSGMQLSALTTVTAGDGGVKLVSTNSTAGALTVSTGAGTDHITVDGASVASLSVGAGNDVVRLNSSAPGMGANIDLGDGDDVLVVAAPLAGTGWTIEGGAGRDTLQMNTTDMSLIDAVTGFDVLALAASGTIVSVDSFAGNEFAVVNTGTTTFTDARASSVFSIDNRIGVAAVNIVSAVHETSVDVTLNNVGIVEGARTLGTLSLSGATSISLTSSGTGANANVINTLAHADGALITIDGNADLTITNALFGGSLGSTVNASALTGRLSIIGSSRSETIIGGAGDDVIYGGMVTQGTAAVDAVAEVATLQANAGGLAAGASISVAGLSFTAGGSPLTQGQVAQVFAGLANGATTGAMSGLGSYTGTLTGYTTSTASGGVVTFTAATTGERVDLSASGTGAAAVTATVTTQGQNASSAVPGTLDTLTGGGGADTFVFNTGDSSARGGAVTTLITDFTPGTDKLQVFSGSPVSPATFVKAGAISADLDTMLAGADAALDGIVKFYVGQVGGDAYVVTDSDGVGYTNIIKLTGVTMAAFQSTDLIV